MSVPSRILFERYIIILRLIQPARIQDIINMHNTIFNITEEERISRLIKKIHDNMKREQRIIQVRRGTYILDAASMNIASRLVKERNLDNERIFLMKRQRKRYVKNARRLGLSAESASQNSR